MIVNMGTFKKQFHVLHGRKDFSSDQLDLITAEVKNRQRILTCAMENLEMALACMQKTPIKTKIL